jgi:ATP synthase protein I
MLALAVECRLRVEKQSGRVRVRELMKTAGKFQGLGRALGVGSEMVAATGVGAAIGWWLDNLTGWSPWLLILFFILGSAAGFLAVYRGMQAGKEPTK